MATPPAPTAASVQAAQQRSIDLQYKVGTEAVVELVIADLKSKSARRESLQTSIKQIDSLIGKGQADAFVKLADLNTEYGKVVAGGNVQPVDKIKYLVKVMELQKDINKSVGGRNDQRLDAIIRQAEAETGGRAKDPTTNARIWELFYTDAAASAYNPTLVGDMNKLVQLTDVKEPPLGFNIEGDTKVVQQYNDKVAAAQSLDNAAQVIVKAFGPNALSELSSAAGGGGISAEVNTKLQQIPASVYDSVRAQVQNLPGLTELRNRRSKYDSELADIDTALSGDIVARAHAAMSTLGIGGAAKASRTNMKARIVALPKFQEWARSNGMQIGSARPADRSGDKELAGYDSATNTVYVPGPDDERAFVVYHRQISLKPERQILPRRGLEPRKVLSVEVGEPSPDATKVNKDGQFRTLDGIYATDAEIQAARDKKTTAEVSAATGGKVFKMKDGSFAFISDAPDSDLEPISAEDPRVKAAKFSPAVVVPDDETLGIAVAKAPAPSATRTITGRETALLPSDPEGATVIETAEGRRIVIPKEQRVSVTEAPKVTPLAGETTYRGIRMPFAALRARMAGVKGEAAPTPTEAEVEALPEAGGVRAPRVSENGVGLPQRQTPTRQQMLEQNIMPQPSVAVTPGEEAGKQVRDAAGAMTGATAPQPVGVANGGSKATVPVMQTTPEENTRMAAIKARLEGRIREMRDARMQADKDVVAKAGIMPGQVPASDIMDKLKASGKLQNLPVTGAIKAEERLLPVTRGQPVAQPVLLDQPSMLTPSSVGFAKSVVKSAGLLEGEEQMRQAEMTDEQRAEQRRQGEEDLKMLGVSSAKPSPSNTARQTSIDEARRKRIAQAAARKRAEDAARAGMELPPPTMAPYVP